MENVFEVKNLNYKNILKEITFSLSENSFNILVGSNGSGKTTLVNCVRGLLNYQGIINFQNINVNEKNKYKSIGFFIQEDVVIENLVFDELLNILKNLGYEEELAKKRIYNIAKKLDITHSLYKIEKDLLNFEKTLLNFVFSIVHEPKLLIIDNDLETLDEKYKNKIFDYLKNQKKLTVLFITNNSEYFYMANNYIFLKDGKIAGTGSIDDVFSNEKLFIKCGSNLPFNVDLSNKLLSYELLDEQELDIEKLVNKIWQ